MVRPRLSLNSVARAGIKDKSATNLRQTWARARSGSRHEKKDEKKKKHSLGRQFQTIQTIFFLLSECDDKDFCFRIFGQPENKITETEKGAKIAPFAFNSDVYLLQ